MANSMLVLVLGFGFLAQAESQDSAVFDQREAERILNASSDPFAVLLLDRQAYKKVTEEERKELLKKAFRKKMMAFHPDRFVGSPYEKLALQVTKVLNSAHDTLKNGSTPTEPEKADKSSSSSTKGTAGSARPQGHYHYDPQPGKQYFERVMAVLDSLQAGLGPEAGAQKLEALTRNLRAGSSKFGHVDMFPVELYSTWETVFNHYARKGYTFTKDRHPETMLLAISIFLRESDLLPKQTKSEMAVMVYGHAVLNFPRSLKGTLKKLKRNVDPLVPAKWGSDWAERVNWAKNFPNANFAKTQVWSCAKLLVSDYAVPASEALNGVTLGGLSFFSYFYFFY